MMDIHKHLDVENAIKHHPDFHPCFDCFEECHCYTNTKLTSGAFFLPVDALYALLADTIDWTIANILVGENDV